MDRLRPISVSNTDNRIIANVFRASITPCLAQLLEKTQRAFVLGQSIEQNIEEVNHAFYSRLEANEPYHLLLHDFERAYDSISRDYLLTLLRLIGLPTWATNALGALLINVIAKPILLGPHDVAIPMGNGLKQGCPLSPILYNLAMDPLLFALARQTYPAGPPTRQWAYADDLAVGCTDLRSLALALPRVDDFNRASGSSSSKTKSLSSRPLRPPAQTSPKLSHPIGTLWPLPCLACTLVFGSGDRSRWTMSLKEPSSLWKRGLSYSARSKAYTNCSSALSSPTHSCPLCCPSSKDSF